MQVNAKYEDRAALHQAAGIGNIPLTKLLLEFGATVDIEVCALRTDLLWFFLCQVTQSVIAVAAFILFSQDDYSHKPLHLSVIR